jgi:hypothetical protein
MGSHAGQLSREDRWELVHYVQSLRDEKYDWAAVQAAYTQVPASLAADANQTEVNH